jgi:hypothetical protein
VCLGWMNPWVLASVKAYYVSDDVLVESLCVPRIDSQQATVTRPTEVEIDKIFIVTAVSKTFENEQRNAAHLPSQPHHPHANQPNEPPSLPHPIASVIALD